MKSTPVLFANYYSKLYLLCNKLDIQFISFNVKCLLRDATGKKSENKIFSYN